MTTISYIPCQAGDIAFFWSNTTSSRINRVGQSLERRAKARYSHVALCDIAGGYIHANIASGVSYVYFDELLPSDFSGYSAFRHKTLSARIQNDYRNYHTAVAYFLGQNYIHQIEERKFLKGAKKFRGKELGIGETFCSKLVNDIFHQFAPEFAIPDDKPLPIDFQNLINGDKEWVDVTEGHKLYFTHLRADPSMKEIWRSTKQSLMWVREGAQKQDRMVDMVKLIQRVAANLEATHGVRHPVLDIDIDVPAGPITFWDQRHGKTDNGKPKK
jgi:hypothetical protein